MEVCIGICLFVIVYLCVFLFVSWYGLVVSNKILFIIWTFFSMFFLCCQLRENWVFCRMVDGRSEVERKKV